MSHILIIGGTGMLKNVVLYFTKHHQTVSVIGRDQNKFDALLRAKSEHGMINQLRLDYSDSIELKNKLLESIWNHGPIETAICWIHSTAPEAPFVIAEILNEHCEGAKYFHVLGSSHKDPSRVSDSLFIKFKSYNRIKYRRIILGFITQNNGSRWLTDSEISNGVIDAVFSDREEYIIGKVEPWSERP